MIGDHPGNTRPLLVIDVNLQVVTTASVRLYENRSRAGAYLPRYLLYIVSTVRTSSVPTWNISILVVTSFEYNTV